MTDTDHKAGVRNAMANFYKRQAAKIDEIETEATARKPRIKLKPRQIDPENPPEYKEQIRLAAYLDRLGVLWCHVPNERQMSPRAGRALNLQGRKSGIPDCLVFEPAPGKSTGVVIELKRRKGGRLSPTQREFLQRFSALGWPAYCAAGADDAIRWLQDQGYKLP
jgi:hypothetical protein